ncbi:hypothetical protein V3481_018500 [Fusarium oxysporum f. sp. vasinfectum]
MPLWDLASVLPVFKSGRCCIERETPCLNSDVFLESTPADAKNQQIWLTARRWYNTECIVFLILNGNIASRTSWASLNSVAKDFLVSEEAVRHNQPRPSRLLRRTLRLCAPIRDIWPGKKPFTMPS